MSGEEHQTGVWALDASPEGTELRTFVQWKGTDLCIDFYCDCGEHSHFDGFFAYQLQCPGCNAVYELSSRLLCRRVVGADIRSPQRPSRPSYPKEDSP